MYLLPRPDTETLVEQVLNEIDNMSKKTILDAGNRLWLLTVSYFKRKR